MTSANAYMYWVGWAYLAIEQLMLVLTIVNDYMYQVGGAYSTMELLILVMTNVNIHMCLENKSFQLFLAKVFQTIL